MCISTWTPAMSEITRSVVPQLTLTRPTVRGEELDRLFLSSLSSACLTFQERSLSHSLPVLPQLGDTVVTTDLGGSSSLFQGWETKMAAAQDTNSEQVVPGDGGENNVLSVQARYLRSPSPSRFSMISDADTESIFMEPIHLSSAIAATKIINEELKPREIKFEPMSPKLLESAEQLLVEDLYNRVKVKIDNSGRFHTPCIMDIQHALMQKMEAPMELIDEVWPNVYIAEKSVAVNNGRLKRLGITHILNAAHGTGVYTSKAFYTGMDIEYLGIEADDFPDFDLSKYFRKAAEFMDEALLTCRGKVVVCSVMGTSRPAALVAAYLMIFHHKTILDALMTVRRKRPVYPNEGFIQQLRQLNEKLLEERSGCEEEEEEEEEEEDLEALSQCSVVEARWAGEEAASVLGAEVHSIVVEEQEDVASLVPSLARSRDTLIDPEAEEPVEEERRSQRGLAWAEAAAGRGEGRAGPPEGEQSADGRIREWQRKNERFLVEQDAGSGPFAAGDPDGSDSVDSELLQRRLQDYLQEMPQQRARRDSLSTAASTWDSWDERLLEISQRAARGDDTSSLASLSRVHRTREADVASDTSSLFNFCQNNKDKLTALERWRVKRIQFGWNKRGEEEKEEVSEEGVERKSLAGVDLTAYQSWKLKRQKMLGSENKAEVVDLAKVDSDTTSRRSQQRRAELLERSKRTLQESRSLLEGEGGSTISGSIPLSFLCSNMPNGGTADDSVSMLSLGSSMSRARSVSIPPPPLDNNPDPSVSLASIQDWIATVVREQIAISQGDVDTSGQTQTQTQTQSAGGKGGQEANLSHLSLRSAASPRGCLDTQSHLSSASVASFRSERVTTTSKPLYSLFADQVNLQKLSCKEQELRSEMKGRMDAYTKEKVAVDNKRSTLFKKKRKDQMEDEGGSRSGFSPSLGADRFEVVSHVSGGLPYPGPSVPDPAPGIHKWLREVKDSSVSSTRRDPITRRETIGTPYDASRETTTSFPLNRADGSDLYLPLDGLKSTPRGSGEYTSRQSASSYGSKDLGDESALRYSSPSSEREHPAFCGPLGGGRGPCSGRSLAEVQPPLDEAVSRARTSQWHSSETEASDETHAKRTFQQSFAPGEGQTGGQGNDGENPTAKRGLKAAASSGHSDDEDDKVIAAWRSHQQSRGKDRKQTPSE
ncbi:serine/threonine/tyrosine-interacting-like protein 2 isoform X2 [Amblyraja radiata]|uniref:serine/threonine/tyrosine-interacting-like protein 2 isoform X2 n=1 Tax=Amblyraja radiata TaxID=386614 RepID=UPI001402A8B2|nr:serine/threonine/tyrosine-interacting-like protein 2 isoform X2 [Amblyraja radiata]